jgi:signal peptidase I
MQMTPHAVSAPERDARPASRGIAVFAIWTASWAVIGAVAVLLAVGLVVPRLAGAHPYAIETGSMTPTLPAGTLVVVKAAQAGDIGIGAVITYQVESGKPTVVTHRVVAQGVDGRGNFVYWTKGDANSAVDATPVRPVQVRGKLWYSVPYVGYLSVLLTRSQRTLLIYGAIAGLMAYAGAMFVGAARDRRRAVAT